MIRDLEGAETGGRAAPRWLLSAGTAACVGAFIVAIATFRPPAPPATGAQTSILRGPSVLARLTPAPARSAGPPIELPQGMFASVVRLNLSGVTGLVPASAAEAGVTLRYRLNDGRALALTWSRDDLVYATSTMVMREVRVRGTAGRMLIPNGRDQATVLAWTEDQLHYQLVSGSIAPDELIAIAEHLR